MRLVLDLNVFVSAVVAGGKPGELLVRWRVDDAFELVVCPLLLDELAEVLRREKFAGFITAAEVDALLVLLRDRAVMADDPTETVARTRDPDDDYLLTLAVESDADALVSGDLDLLELEEPPLLVWTPAEALLHVTG